MENISTQILAIQTRHCYTKKYKRAYNIRSHQKRKRLKKKWNNIINRYNKKYLLKDRLIDVENPVSPPKFTLPFERRVIVKPDGTEITAIDIL
jgi:hypothetical protein